MQTDYVVKDIGIILQALRTIFISSNWQAICLFQRFEMLLVCIFVAVEGVMPELRVPLIADIGVGANWLEAH
ncbi:hypothetical protein SJDPG12_00355 [Porphyromonas gingivalis SJD12]|uniref:hypothetical protein n=1 Tax=Porphyromonas gingivalis TaxID=837 RepID=UPI000B5127A2|nr:hypothetical protein [Porphyromonas gingivalis]MCE8177827.1 hypothetical protein [Porphyromonas gingivalis]OWR83350.1 hypothetical protein SJDPG12_00355 [Porphyromonas gingivalis SJD12]